MKKNVLIPSFNDESSLRKLLDLLSEFDEVTKIAIVDGASSDGSSNLVKSYVDDRIIWISSDEFSSRKSKSPIAKSRNMALTLFQADSIVVFIDLGCTYNVESIRALLGAFQDESVDYAYAPTVAVTTTEYSKKYKQVWVKDSKGYQIGHFPSSRFLAMQYKVLKELGGYKEMSFAGEDTEFAIRLVKLFNGKLVDGSVGWVVPKTRREAVIKHFKYGVGDGVYRNNIYIIFFCLFFAFIPTKMQDISFSFSEKIILRWAYAIGGIYGLTRKV